MGLMSWIFYTFLGIILFFILLFLENKYHLEKVEKMAFSIIYLMIISGIFLRFRISYTENIFLIFVFLMISDVIYNSYFIENDFFDKNDKNIYYYLILIFIGFLINQEFINQVNEVFLTGEDLRILLWGLVFIFFYYFCQNKKVFSKKNIMNSKNHFMSEESVLVHYAKFRLKYHEDCCFENQDITNLIYAIMIFEDNRRNRLLRNYDYLLFRLTGNKRKLGIMQIESSEFITDSASISLAYKKMEKIYYKLEKEKGIKANSKINIEDFIKNYDSKNQEYIQYIFDILKKF